MGGRLDWWFVVATLRGERNDFAFERLFKLGARLHRFARGHVTGRVRLERCRGLSGTETELSARTRPSGLAARLGCERGRLVGRRQNDAGSRAVTDGAVRAHGAVRGRGAMGAVRAVVRELRDVRLARREGLDGRSRRTPRTGRDGELARTRQLA